MTKLKYAFNLLYRQKTNKYSALHRLRFDEFYQLSSRSLNSIPLYSLATYKVKTQIFAQSLISYRKWIDS